MSAAVAEPIVQTPPVPTPGADPATVTPPEPTAEKTYTQEQYKAALAKSVNDAKEKLKRDPDLIAEIRQQVESEAQRQHQEQQGEFKPLYEQAQQRITELESEREKVETIKAERDAALEVVAALVADELKAAPDYVSEAIADKSPVEQLRYVQKNREKWRTTPQGIPPTPRPAHDADLTAEERTAAARSYAERLKSVV